MKKVLFGEQGVGPYKIGLIELNRPQLLNSLDTETLALIEKKLIEWSFRKDIAVLFFHSANKKAFCAGGDVKSLSHEVLSEGLEAGHRFFRQEYFVDNFIHHFKKPIIAWLDGITMGGGLGLVRGAPFRIVTETSRLAMPEVFIHLYPDVGATRFLAEGEPGLGLFLGLSGLTIGPSFALQSNWATHFFAASEKHQILADLSRLEWGSEPEQNKKILEEYIYQKSKSFSVQLNLYDHATQETWQKIKKEFLFLQKMSDLKALIELVNSHVSNDKKKRSLFSQALFARLFEKNKKASWAHVFLLEKYISVEMMQDEDFHKGVKAILIDKTGLPEWKTESIEQALDRAQKLMQTFQPDQAFMKKLLALELGDKNHPL